MTCISCSMICKIFFPEKLGGGGGGGEEKDGENRQMQSVLFSKQTQKIRSIKQHTQNKRAPQARSQVSN